MNPIDLVDLKAFNEESLLFEIVSSQENSAYNSFANEEMECLPTEFEKNYFEELSRVLGEEVNDDEIEMFQNEMKSDSFFSYTNSLNYSYNNSLHNNNYNTTSSFNNNNNHNNNSYNNSMKNTYNTNPFQVNINEWTTINSLHLLPLDISQNSTEKIPNSLYNFPNAIDERNENEVKEKVSLKWRTQPCAYFQANGFCKKGDKCNFSHEIPHQTNKPFVPADQLYRTKPCHFFFTTGVCRKGENCNFSHDPTIFEKSGGKTSPTQEE